MTRLIGLVAWSLLDVTALPCAPANLPEVVYRLVLTSDATVKVTATDASGQGVGVQVRADSCSGTSVGCDWGTSGSVARSYPLTAGTWFVILERSPAGAFTFAIE